MAAEERGCRGRRLVEDPDLPGRHHVVPGHLVGRAHAADVEVHQVAGDELVDVEERVGVSHRGAGSGATGDGVATTAGRGSSDATAGPGSRWMRTTAFTASRQPMMTASANGRESRLTGTTWERPGRWLDDAAR